MEEVTHFERKKYSKIDRSIFSVAGLFLVLATYCFMADDSIFGLLKSRALDGSLRPIGKISAVKNFSRHRSADLFAWEEARGGQRVSEGDSLFTGSDSSAQVVIDEGGTIDLESNSLVRFERIKEDRVANLGLGRFRMKVDGEMKMAIRGEVTKIKGDQAEIQIVVQEGQNPKIQVLSGKAQMSDRNGKPSNLMTAGTSLKKPIEKLAVVAPPKLIPRKAEGVIHRTTQFSDEYESIQGKISYRHSEVTAIPFSYKIHLESVGKVTVFYAEVSPSPDFMGVKEIFALTLKSPFLTKAFLGKNYLRLSLDQTNWVDAGHFEIQSSLLNLTPPQIQLSDSKILDPSLDGVNLGLTVLGNPVLRGSLIELSMDANFPPERTLIRYVSLGGVKLNLPQPGNYFVRSRGVDDQQGLTARSHVTILNWSRPETTLSPRLAQTELKVFEKQKVNLAWRPPAQAQKYIVEIKDRRGRILEQKTVDHPAFTWTGNLPGSYTAEVSTLDRWNRRSPVASRAEITVEALPIPRLPTSETSPAPLAATPQPTATLAAEVASIPEMLRADYRDSYLDFEGAGFTMESQDQALNGADSPIAGLLKIGGQQWWDQLGLGASYKKKVVGFNSAGGDSGVEDLEVRSSYRWDFLWNPFPKSRGSQVVAIGAIESYRNQSAGYFSPQYHLLKAGLGLDFALMEAWQTGGELFFGLGTDQSKKYQISGYLHYLLKKTWSVGIGYRVHLFEAGSEASAPAGLPFREGYGEGYSVIRYRY